jgi:hypothetical protein
VTFSSSDTPNPFGDSNNPFLKKTKTENLNIYAVTEIRSLEPACVPTFGLSADEVYAYSEAPCHEDLQGEMR